MSKKGLIYIMLKHCRSKEELNCCYLTKENINEFIDILKQFLNYCKYKDIRLLKINDDHILTEYVYNYDGKEFTKFERYYYNYWYVEEFDYYGELIGWMQYKDEDFNKWYEFINIE